MHAIRKLTIAVVILVLALGIPGSVEAQPSVTGPTTLTLPLGYTNPIFGAFNEVGQAVGFATNPQNGLAEAIQWKGSENPTILGVGWALGINNLGQVVGMNAESRVALWQPGKEPLIIATPNTDGISGGTSINESGVFAGCYGVSWFWNISAISGAFIYDTTKSKFIDLNPVLGPSCAYDINDLGQVVGDSENGIFVYNYPSGEIKYLTSDPGTGAATAINNMGWVAGYSIVAAGHQHAFLWKPGDSGLTLLGESTFQAKGINDYGMITGDILGSDGKTRGFLWSDGGLLQLPTGTGSTRTEAWRISNRVVGPDNVAYIAGTDTLSSGVQAVFWQAELPPVTPQDQITYIKDQTTTLIGSGALSKGQGNALSSKLDAAARQLEKGKNQPAINLLGAFINQTEALGRSGRLSPANELLLIALANQAIKAIQALP